MFMCTQNKKLKQQNSRKVKTSAFPVMYLDEKMFPSSFTVDAYHNKIGKKNCLTIFLFTSQVT